MARRQKPLTRTAKKNEVTVSPTFKLVLFIALGLTLLSLLTSILLAIIATPSEDTKRLIETCSTTYKMGFGAIIGLIGGKALP